MALFAIPNAIAAAKDVLPPHKGGPSLGATSPTPKDQGLKPEWTADYVLDRIIDARATNKPFEVAHWSRILHLVTTGDLAGAVRDAMRSCYEAMRDASVGLPWEVALSSQASHVFEEPVAILNENEEIRVTIERRPIRKPVKPDTAKPAPVGAGISKSAAVTVDADGKVVHIASDDDIPEKRPASRQAEYEATKAEIEAEAADDMPKTEE